MENEHRTMKKRKIKPWMIVLSVFLVAIIAVGIWQRNNIGALYIYATNDSEEIKQKLEEVEKQIEDDLKSISDDEASDTEMRENKPDSHKPTTETKPKIDNSKRILELIDEIYAMRSYYVAQLDSIHSNAMYSFWSLPKEQRTMDTKKSMALALVDQAAALEKECDGRMNEILTELEKLLEEEGKGTSICDRIAYSYAKEKQIKKAELMEILAADPNRNNEN